MANSQEQTKPVAWRPEVVAFASLMERELRENDWKGGWKHCNFASLMSHVWEEARELQEALLSYPRDTQKYRERIASEGADIANMVMMVLDVRGALSPSAAPPAESERIAAPTSAQFDDVAWLWTHCRSLGMQKKSLSGSMRDDVGLFARDQNDRIAALEAEKQANYEHWRNAEIDLERHRAALKVAREALEGWRSVDVHSALTEDEADAIKAKDDAALRAIEGVRK